jgi:hypothetical protein
VDPHRRLTAAPGTVTDVKPQEQWIMIAGALGAVGGAVIVLTGLLGGGLGAVVVGLLALGGGVAVVLRTRADRTGT